jgi:hypothetical protein
MTNLYEYSAMPYDGQVPVSCCVISFCVDAVAKTHDALHNRQTAESGYDIHNNSIQNRSLAGSS